MTRRLTAPVLIGAIAILVALGATLATVVIVEQSAERSAREREQLRSGCARNLADRADGIARDVDLAAFARRAAQARRATGDPEVADDYDRIARDADSRRREASRRMLGAPVTSPTPAAIAAACARAYP